MASVRSLTGVIKWLHREEWCSAFDEWLDRHLGRACAKAGIAIDELPDVVGEEHSSVLWGCVLEDFLARDLDDGRNIVDDYLKRRGWKETASNRAYLAALRSSAMSLYEVSGIVRDVSFLARDLVRGGEPIRVSERSGTHYLKPWDRIAARIVTVGARTEMAGGVLPFDHAASEAVLEAFRNASRNAHAEAVDLARKLGRAADDPVLARALSDTQVLRASAFLFTNIWLGEALRRTLNPTLPEMCNSDGDELVFITVHYPLRPEVSADMIRDALAAVPAFRAESATFWNWIGSGKRNGKTKKADPRLMITTMNDESVVLGTLKLKHNLLVFETNSKPRAGRGRALIEPPLDKLVGEPLLESRTVTELMASPRSGTPKARAPGLTPDAERAIVHATLDRHYVNLLDQPVPALGNISPRRAARSAKNREKLVAWLKLLENSTARHDSGSPMADYDVTWIWEELGVAQLRR
jgi:hypothetical protein